MLASVQKLSETGVLKNWGAAVAELPPRRNVMLGEPWLFWLALGHRSLCQSACSAERPCRPPLAGELRMVGVKDPEAVARPSVRNDALFLMSVVGGSSLLAVILGQLPGDWGGFGA